MISIITVNYNSGKELQRTFDSISKIKKNYYELIVIDGCSNDESKNSLIDYNFMIDVLVIEKDKGLYDAMNKGVRYASHKWIIFINAGDMINELNFPRIYEKLSSSNSDIIYGDVIGLYKNYKIKYKPKTLENVWSGKPYHHQASFYKTKVIQLYPFRLKYKICSDHDQMFRMLNDGKIFEYFDCVISTVQMSFGKSKNNKKKVLVETIEICRENKVDNFKILILKLRVIKNIIYNLFKNTLAIKFLRKIKNYNS